ncbi:DUF5107 domain-containing protein [Bacteroidota bacterium]
MMKKLFVLSGLLLIVAAGNFLFAQQDYKSKARIWEEDITLPTDLIGEKGKNPRFYFGRAYQGAQGRVYPYPISEVLTDVRVDKTYKALRLENEFLNVSLIPEIGGKLFTGRDKTNDYNFIYQQTVVKPVLIGMLGAWISGGVEWNVFHHHRATTFTPVDYQIEENPDGSVTAWVGEIEIRHRMKWRVGVTIHPGKSYIETIMIAHNRSPFIHSILYFTNVGVHSNENYQVIFPPSTEWVTQHAKREYAGWPIAHETYNGVDFTALGEELGTDGTDISLWKNNFKQISYFAYNYEDDWMVGYDHGKQAGTCIVGDHHTVPGKKFWTTGSGDRGKVWDVILTDTDGPELELMAGGYSDNEPDYSWIQPGETKTNTQYFYPIRQMPHVKNANKEAAVNLDIEKGNSADLAFNTTSCRNNATVRVLAGEDVILEETINICPDNPYNKKISLPANTDPNKVVASLISEEGTELISYCPKKTSPGAFPGYSYEGDLEKGTRTPMPETVERPGLPADIESNEMLYLTGMRLEQFYNPSVDPMPYYEEALRRDPGDQRVNTAVGILMLRQGRFDDAKKHLTRAIERTNWNYTHARFAEPFYYMGLAQKYTGQYKEAYDNLYYATWDNCFKSPGHYLLAELACIKEDYPVALDHLEQSLSSDVNNLKALNLKSAVLRKTGNAREAAELANKTVSKDLLDFWSRNELYLAQLDLGKNTEAAETLEGLKLLMRDEVNSYLELAVDYGNCGMWEEAIDITGRLIGMDKEGVSTYPILYYYSAYCFEQLGDLENADKNYQLAAQMPPDYCFPFRLEMINILNKAMVHNPKDAMAPYYLGNLLYDSQPEAAIVEWEKSKDIGTDHPTVYRNLGLAYNKNRNDLGKSIEFYEKAVELNPEDSRVVYELDDIYRLSQKSPEKRLAMLEKHRDNIIKSWYLPPLEREIELHVLMGDYTTALELMKPHHFKRWEGGGNVYTSYVNANLLRGVQHMNNQEFDKALADFNAAGEFPLSMEAAKPWTGGRTCEVLCYKANLYEAMGDKKEAKKTYEKVLSERQGGRSGETTYYRGYALKKLGREEEAKPIFEGMIRSGERRLESIGSTTGMSFFAKFGDRLTAAEREAGARYQIGLGMLGLDRIDKAKAEFEAAAALDVNDLWSRAKLSEIESMQ